MDRLCLAAEDPNSRRTSPSLGAVLRAFLSSVTPLLNLGARPRRVLRLLAACGLPELGANIYQCARCQKRHFAPRSCGDRHCPRCLSAKSRRWLDQQLASLLPVTYYHCVFTLPEELHALVLLNPKQLYPLLFASAARTLLEFGRNHLGGDLGLTAVLHTWGQQLNFHPHLHCIACLPAGRSPAAPSAPTAVAGVVPNNANSSSRSKPSPRSSAASSFMD
jgi:hypothetical protein